MKKLSKIAFAAVSVFAMLGSAILTSCVHSYPELDVAVKPGYIIGGCTADASGEGVKDLWSSHAVPLNYDKNGVATYEFEYTNNCATCWGDGLGKSSFKLLLDETGATNWGTGDVIEIEKDVEQPCPAVDNTKLDGLVIGNKYKVTITAKGATITAKYEMTQGKVAAKVLASVGGNLIDMEFDSKDTYSAVFLASDTNEKISIYSEGKYYFVEDAIALDKDVELTASEEAKTNTISGLGADRNYTLSVKISGDKYIAKVIKAPLLKDVKEISRMNGNIFDGAGADLTWNDDKAVVEIPVGTQIKGWGRGPQIELGIAKNGSWDNKFCNVSKITAAGTYTIGEGSSSEAGNNLVIAIPGLVNESDYKTTKAAKFTVISTATTISLLIEITE